MDHSVEKLLYSRRDTAEALCLSIRSVDYLITTGRLFTRRIGGKILIPTSAVRRFAREDHPESVRAAGVPIPIGTETKLQPSGVPPNRFAPQSETNDDVEPSRASGSRRFTG
jgi:hypothetical protein